MPRTRLGCASFVVRRSERGQNVVRTVLELVWPMREGANIVFRPKRFKDSPSVLVRTVTIQQFWLLQTTRFGALPRDLLNANAALAGTDRVCFLTFFRSTLC